jgi:hypothetical protein
MGSRHPALDGKRPAFVRTIGRGGKWARGITKSQAALVYTHWLTHDAPKSGRWQDPNTCRWFLHPHVARREFPSIFMGKSKREANLNDRVHRLCTEHHPTLGRPINKKRIGRGRSDRRSWLADPPKIGSERPRNTRTTLCKTRATRPRPSSSLTRNANLVRATHSARALRSTPTHVLTTIEIQVCRGRQE